MIKKAVLILLLAQMLMTAGGEVNAQPQLTGAWIEDPTVDTQHVVRVDGTFVRELRMQGEPVSAALNLVDTGIARLTFSREIPGISKEIAGHWGVQNGEVYVTLTNRWSLVGAVLIKTYRSPNGSAPRLETNVFFRSITAPSYLTGNFQQKFGNLYVDPNLRKTVASRLYSDPSNAVPFTPNESSYQASLPSSQQPTIGPAGLPPNSEKSITDLENEGKELDAEIRRLQGELTALKVEQEKERKRRASPEYKREQAEIARREKVARDAAERKKLTVNKEGKATPTPQNSAPTSIATRDASDASVRSGERKTVLERVIGKKWSFGNLACNLNGGAYTIFDPAAKTGVRRVIAGKFQQETPQRAEYRYEIIGLNKFIFFEKIYSTGNNMVERYIGSGVEVLSRATEYTLEGERSLSYKTTSNLQLKIDEMFKGNVVYEQGKLEAGTDFLCDDQLVGPPAPSMPKNSGAHVWPSPTAPVQRISRRAVFICVDDYGAGRDETLAENLIDALINDKNLFPHLMGNSLYMKFCTPSGSPFINEALLNSGGRLIESRGNVEYHLVRLDSRTTVGLISSR